MLAQAAAFNYLLRFLELLLSLSLLCLSAQRLHICYASFSCLSRFMSEHLVDLIAQSMRTRQ